MSQLQLSLEQVKEEFSDIAIRALKTFLQAFVAVLLVTNEPFSKQALVAAVAAGVSALFNTIRAAAPQK